MTNFIKNPHIRRGTIVTYKFFWIRRRLCCRSCWRNLVVSRSSFYLVLSFPLYLDLRPNSCSSLSRLLSCINWRFSTIWMEKDSWFYFSQLNDYFMQCNNWWFNWKLSFLHTSHSFIHTYIFIQKTEKIQNAYIRLPHLQKDYDSLVLHQSQRKENYVWFGTRERCNKGGSISNPRTSGYHSRLFVDL